VPGRPGPAQQVETQIAVKALNRNKMRTALTMLGMIIGVAAVIAIVALGQGASASVASQLAGLGTNLLTIQPGSGQSGGAQSGAGTGVTLTAGDATATVATRAKARMTVAGDRPLTLMVAVSLAGSILAKHGDRYVVEPWLRSKVSPCRSPT